MRTRRVRVRRESCRPGRGVGCRAASRRRTSGWRSPATRWPRWSASWRPGRRRQPARRSSRRPAGSAPSWASSASSSRVTPTRTSPRPAKTWGTDFQWNKEKGIVTVSVAEGECSCPLVDNKRTPAFFCNCSVGYQKEAFETIFGTTGPGLAQGIEARWQQALRVRSDVVARGEIVGTGPGKPWRMLQSGLGGFDDDGRQRCEHPANARLPAVLGPSGVPPPGLRGPRPHVDHPGEARGPALAEPRPDGTGRPPAVGLSRSPGPVLQQARPARAAGSVALRGRASPRHGAGLHPVLADPARHQPGLESASRRGGTRTSSPR